MKRVCSEMSTPNYWENAIEKGLLYAGHFLLTIPSAPAVERLYCSSMASQYILLQCTLMKDEPSELSCKSLIIIGICATNSCVAVVGLAGLESRGGKATSAKCWKVF